MYSRTQLLEIINGQRNGLLPTLTRIGLSCLTPVYRIAVYVRNRKYDRALENHDQSLIQRAGIPVISVGNLTTGGTGKTPHVIWIAGRLRAHHLRVALISRGYGSDHRDGGAGRNDEARELEHRLPDVPHLQDPDRVRMSQIAIEELESQVIVLDDAFQHRQIHRDLDLVLIDATVPFGFDRMLPRGLLREPVSSLRRADMVIITRVNLVDHRQLETILQRIRPLLEGRLIAQTQTRVAGLLCSDGTQRSLETISGQSVFVFCGIGNPENFTRTIESLDSLVAGTHYFDDHHLYARTDVQQIGELANACGASAIVCTHKDLVKISTNRVAGLPVFAVLIDIEFISGQAELEQRIDELAATIDQR